MAITITALMTSEGIPYNGYTPTISIWKVPDETKIINEASMTQVSTTCIYKYDFTSFVYGVNYVYIISGDPTVDDSENHQWGNVMQEEPDRIVGTVQSDAGNSATQFKTDRVESTSDFWKDALCLFLSGTLVGQVKKVTSYSGSTYIVTFSNGFTGTPTAGDTYTLINF